MDLFLYLGMLVMIAGIYSVIKRKLPFIRMYNGVKNISLYSVVSGLGMILISFTLISFYVLRFSGILLVGIFLVIAAGTLILQVATKSI